MKQQSRKTFDVGGGRSMEVHTCIHHVGLLVNVKHTPANLSFVSIDPATLFSQVTSFG